MEISFRNILFCIVIFCVNNIFPQIGIGYSPIGTIDGIPPTGKISLISPGNGMWQSSTPLFSFNPENISGASKLMILVDGNYLADELPLSSTSYKIPQNSALTNGWHTWTVRALDKSGNYLQASQTLSINVDAEPPLDFNLKIPSDSLWTNGSFPYFEWTSSADNGSGLMMYQLFNNDSLTKDSIAPLSTQTSATLLTDGKYIWYIKAIDSVGNSKQSKNSQIVFVDKTPPVSSITLPLNNQVLKSDTLFIEGSSNDAKDGATGIGVHYVLLSKNGGLNWDTVFTSSQKQSGIIVWRKTYSNFSSGSFTIISKSIDWLENTEVNTPSVTVIVPSKLALTSPNGSENWPAGSVHSITWTYQGSNIIKIEYSLNNGGSWITVTDSTSSARLSYLWTIPNTQTDQCKVKISQLNDAANFDISDNVFSISNPVTTLSGRVTDSRNGNPITGAIVSLLNFTTTTDNLGSYTFSNIPIGALVAAFAGYPASGTAPLQVQFADFSAENTYSINVAKTDFVSYSNNHLVLTPNTTNYFDISLTPLVAQGKMRIVLNWGNKPTDLDSHLMTPQINGTSYHIYYLNRGDSLSNPYSVLDIDKRDGYGPETITIHQLFDGTYSYFVKQFSIVGNLPNSNAVVQVYTSDGLVKTYNVPSSGDGLYWHVFNVEGISKTITDVNQIVNLAPALIMQREEKPTNIISAIEDKQGKAQQKSSPKRITSWEWNFGDSTKSSEQNPLHIYSYPGKFSVSLKVLSGTLQATEIKTNYITVNEPGITISGIATYDNTSNTPLSNVQVLLKVDSILVKSIFTDTSGAYSFENIKKGNYNLTAACTKGWGGVNSTDALQIRRHIAGVITLSGIRLTSSDVNSSGSVNSTDALFIRRRIAGIINTFPAGDWSFESAALTVNSSNVIQNIKGVCTGDANGSYIPTISKPIPIIK